MEELNHTYPFPQMTRIISNLLMRGRSGNHSYFLIRALREIRGFSFSLLMKNF